MIIEHAGLQGQSLPCSLVTAFLCDRMAVAGLVFSLGLNGKTVQVLRETRSHL